MNRQHTTCLARNRDIPTPTQLPRRHRLAQMDHLVCFVPGMLAQGAFSAAGTPGEARAVDDLVAAKALAYTCWQMDERTATGIAAEFVDFPGGADLVPGDRAPFYILRPEAAEALFVLHQLTGNPVYREWGWRMFSVRAPRG